MKRGSNFALTVLTTSSACLILQNEFVFLTPDDDLTDQVFSKQLFDLANRMWQLSSRMPTELLLRLIKMEFQTFRIILYGHNWYFVWWTI